MFRWRERRRSKYPTIPSECRWLGPETSPSLVSTLALRWFPAGWAAGNRTSKAQVRLQELPGNLQALECRSIPTMYFMMIASGVINAATKSASDYRRPWPVQRSSPRSNIRP